MRYFENVSVISTMKNLLIIIITITTHSWRGREGRESDLA